MTESEVFIYDGHSGLGGYFDAEMLFPDFTAGLNKLKSQVFFLNGCSTFSYYNHSYFQNKKTAADPLGYRNLDIVTNAIGALFTVGSANDALFIKFFSQELRRDWRSIIDEIYAVEPNESPLTQINGDETNPRIPGKGNDCPLGFHFKPAGRSQKHNLCVANKGKHLNPISWDEFFQ